MCAQDSSAVAAARKVCSLGRESVSLVSDAGALFVRLVDVHGIDSKRLYWWESLKKGGSLHYRDSGDGWRAQVSSLLTDMGDPVFLVVTDDEPPPWPVLRFERGTEVVKLLGDMHFFEYFVFSQNCGKVFFDTHDNFLIWSP
ncbi:hypothetical protein [Stenotrophomonas sp. GZD-301]|uniref:hypothetical protein n=1 Tax=Stenotrophomonas sp. GZD-301 TaxID=3404814 RepID=UPI003BB7F526